MGYYAEFGRSRSTAMDVRWSPKFFKALEQRAFGIWEWLTP